MITLFEAWRLVDPATRDPSTVDNCMHESAESDEPQPKPSRRYHLFLVPKQTEQIDEALNYGADHISDVEGLRDQNAKLKAEIESLRNQR